MCPCVQCPHPEARGIIHEYIMLHPFIYSSRYVQEQVFIHRFEKLLLLSLENWFTFQSVPHTDVYVFNDHGLKPISSAVGDKFYPKIFQFSEHEIFSSPSLDNYSSQTLKTTQLNVYLNLSTNSLLCLRSVLQKILMIASVISHHKNNEKIQFENNKKYGGPV